MIEPWIHEIARQRHQELLARGDRYRLGRIIGDPNAHRRTVSHWLKFSLGWIFGMWRRAAVPATRHVAAASDTEGIS